MLWVCYHQYSVWSLTFGNSHLKPLLAMCGRGFCCVQYHTKCFQIICEAFMEHLLRLQETSNHYFQKKIIHTTLWCWINMGSNKGNAEIFLLVELSVLCPPYFGWILLWQNRMEQITELLYIKTCGKFLFQVSLNFFHFCQFSYFNCYIRGW